MTEKIRIKDIAEKAGVSTGTVDRVLHNRGEVKPETRELVLKIASELNYRPNIAAQLLKKSFGYQIAILIPKPTNDKCYWSEHPVGIENALRIKTPYNISVTYFLYSLNDGTDFVNKSEERIDSKPGGVIIAPLHKIESVSFCKQLDQNKIPYVFIDTNLEGVNNLSYTGENSIKSSRTAASLIDAISDQNVDVLIVNISKDITNSEHLNSRNDGFNTYFKEKGYSNRNRITVNISSDSMDEIQNKLNPVFSTNKNIGAIFVTSSRVHVVANYLHNQKISVKLIGYDLIEENIKYLNVGIIDFLISQRPVQQGEKSMEILTDFLIGNESVFDKSFYQPIDIVNKENLFTN